MEPESNPSVCMDFKLVDSLKGLFLRISQGTNESWYLGSVLNNLEIRTFNL